MGDKHVHLHENPCRSCPIYTHTRAHTHACTHTHTPTSQGYQRGAVVRDQANAVVMLQANESQKAANPCAHKSTRGTQERVACLTHERRGGDGGLPASRAQRRGGWPACLTSAGERRVACLPLGLAGMQGCLGWVGLSNDAICLGWVGLSNDAICLGWVGLSEDTICPCYSACAGQHAHECNMPICAVRVACFGEGQSYQ